jgi:hypothetical protein
MKYDFSKCNNLQFKAKDDDGEVMTGYLKVTKEGEECVVYVFPTDSGGNETYDRGLQLVIRDYARGEIIEDFSDWAEEHDLEIVPRDPETYTDWKVGDKVISNKGNQVNTLIAVLGKAIVLVRDGAPFTGLTTTDSLTKYDKLILTDYEQELLAAQEKEKCPFREGDKVLVRDYDSSEWRFAIFESYNKNSKEPYKMKFSTLSYRQCIHLNEHTWKLLGTTDEYKEEE